MSMEELGLLESACDETIPSLNGLPSANPAVPPNLAPCLLLTSSCKQHNLANLAILKGAVSKLHILPAEVKSVTDQEHI